jgi:hypothetical protein
MPQKTGWKTGLYIDSGNFTSLSEASIAARMRVNGVAALSQTLFLRKSAELSRMRTWDYPIEMM